MKISTVLLALLIPVFPGLAGAQEVVDSVALRFAWPVGMTARVEQEWSRVQATPTKRDSTYVRSAYRLQVADHPQGRLIEMDSFRIVPAPGQQLNATVDGEQIVARLGSLLPSYVVSVEGEFLAVADIERMKSAFDSILAPVRQQSESGSPQVRALLANMTSPQALTAAAAQEWNLVVGTWVGADWEVGAAYEYSAEEPIPYLPGQKVKMNYEFAAVERVPCAGSEREARCVELFMRSAPDSAAFAGLLRTLFETIAPDQRSAVEGLQNMRAVNELTVIAEPATLRPHSVELIKFVEVGVAPSSGDAGGKTMRLDRRAASYTYTN